MRQVTQADAPALAQLIRATGLDHNPDPERIARVSLESNHVTLIETAIDGALIGFVDAFSTVSSFATPRWEVDLLGVHPTHRGRGIAQSLVREVVKSAQAIGLTDARALVHVDNRASTNTFLHCGFTLDETIRHLFVSDQEMSEAVIAPLDTHLLSVSTLTYTGIWIEGEQSLEALCCAQTVRTRYRWDIAGAVIAAAADPTPLGYELVGQYRWLKRTL
ncbi:MAG: GNAT family N-acetyltransferase [Chloroflexota bacterium]